MVPMFKERKKLAKQYEQWLQENPQIKDSPFNVISFLAGIGRLKNKETDWISCEERLPKEHCCKVWLSFTNKYTSYSKSAWWDEGKFYWQNGREVKEKPTAWMHYQIPQPYKKEGVVDESN